MKFIAIILFNLSFMIILFIPIQVRAQPYVYRGHLNKYYENDDTSRIYYKINYTRLDLSNGQKDSLSTYGPNLLCDNTQNWIISGRQSWRICNFYDKNQCFDLGPQPIIAVYSEQKNKIFIATEMGTFDVLDPITGTEETLLNVDYYYSNSLSGGEGPSGKIFLSADEKTVYIPFYDTVFSPVRDDRIKLAELSTSTYMVTRTRNLQDLGYPGATFYGLCNGRKGKAIIMSDLYFNIYDFDYTMSSPFIYFAKDADPYFTNDGKYLILNELYDSLSSESKFVQLNNSGKFLIYNVPEQSLVKSIQLPPNWDVYTFDNFPDNLYYYDDNSETAITLNIDSLVTNSPSISELTPAITFPGTQNFTLELKGSKFTSNSVVMWNGSERTTSFVSDSILHASINTSDISSRSNSLVTVKTGYDISDTLMFTVVDSLTMPVHPMLECVHNNGNNTYTAHFGYQNDLDKTVLVPIGGQNSFSPGQTDRGQTTIFYPGRHTDVFTLEFDGSNISWILDMQVKSANSNSPQCN